jgi:L-rhamnose isomerase/sugar isomerase
MILSVLNCQEAYAKAQVVNRAKLAALQVEGDVLAAHRLLTEAFRTDVRPLLAQAREEMGVPVDPIAAYWASGYEEKIRNERGVRAPAGGFQ